MALLIAEAQTRTVAGYSIDVNIVPAAQIAPMRARKPSLQSVRAVTLKILNIQIVVEDGL